MPVGEIMTQAVTAVAPDTPLAEVAAVLVERRISGVPVIDGERLLGVVSVTDLVRRAGGVTTPTSLVERLLRSEAPARITNARIAADVMTSPAVTVDASRSASSAAALMSERDVSRLPVIEDGRVVGIVTRSDLVRTLVR